jgi:MscS family membrane protein
MDFSDLMPIIRQLPPEVQDIVIRLLLLFFVLLFIWVLRHLVSRMVITPLRGLIQRTKVDYDVVFVNAVERPLRLVIIAIALILAATLLNAGDELQRLAAVFARSLVIMAVALGVYNLIDVIALTSVTLRRVTGINIEDRLLPFLRTVIKAFVLIIAALIVVQEFGFDATALIASFGIVGIGIGLAAQDTAANFFGFTAIVSDNPFNVGDFIESGDISGTVEHVGLRSTRVRKLDQSLMTVPNRRLTDASVINWSRLSKRRIDFEMALPRYLLSHQIQYVVDHIRAFLLANPLIDPASVLVSFVRIRHDGLDIRVIGYILLQDWNLYMAELEKINLTALDIVEKSKTAPLIIPEIPAMPVLPSDMPTQSNESASNAGLKGS